MKFSIFMFFHKFGIIFTLMEDTLFTRNNVLDGKYSTNKMISSLETASIVDCVRQCSRNSQCVSIFFKTQTNLCLQNSMFYNHASLTEQGDRVNNIQHSLPDALTTTEPATTDKLTTVIATTDKLTTVIEQQTTETAYVCVQSSTCINGNCVDSSECGCFPNYAGVMCEKAYTYSGCYQISLPLERSVNPATLTIRDCIDECISAGSPYAGLVNGERCYCGGSIASGSQSGGCNVQCPGDNQVCGGATDVSIYHITP